MAFLHGVELVELDGGPRPISGVASSVIGLVGTAKKGPVNTPTLISGSRTEAIATFGVSDGESTIPDALDAIFDQGGAMVVVVNVQEKTTTVAETDNEIVSLGSSGVADLANFYVYQPTVQLVTATATTVDGVTTYSDVTVTATYVQGTDYVITSKTSDDGLDQLVVVDASDLATALETATDADETLLLRVTYTCAPAITAGVTEVISTDDPDAGINALVGAESKVHVTPRILIAPGFTGQSADTTTVTQEQAQTVVQGLIAIADRLRAIVIADGPNTDGDDAITYRNLFDSARLYLVDPAVTVIDSDGNEVEQPASGRVAGIIAKSDNERGFWWSPSNRPMLGITGTVRSIDFALGDKLARANILNENEVATIIHQSGYRLWGNRSCSSDSKWAFISVRRTADLINDALQRAHLWAVDRNITKTYVQDVVEGVNAYLRHLKNIGAIINGTCWADPELNTVDQIAQGKVYFDFDFTPPYPAEHITFRSSLVNDYLEEIFA